MANAFSFNPTISEFFVSDLPQNTSPLKVHFQYEDDDLRIHTLKGKSLCRFKFLNKIFIVLGW
ncbi:hypothetical protein H5410_039742 [Solanum commersonii]|uniref:Uncharacterized protein n=1 Tax=Solanum commersonii TaxID=4109 RepID=A0A9J5XPE7_SOLCO|nr:hypothetical protein H5410_039742 [Solanum commersonii]